MNSPDLLRLPSLKAIGIEDLDSHLQVTAVGRLEPTACPECDSGLYRHGSKAQTFIDTPLHGKPLAINMERQRYRCKACSKTFFEPLPDIDDKRMMTERAVKYVRENCIKDTFAKVARQLGIDAMTVRRIFDDFSGSLKTAGRFQTPEILGIDELKIIGEYRCMLTNIDQLSIYDLLPTRKKADLLTYFQNMPDKQNVRVLTMDMWNVYRQVAAISFPGRPVVADHFHVVRMANDALERVRKRVRRELDTKTRLKLKNERFVLLKRYKDLSTEDRERLLQWSLQFPELGVAHAAKEAFFEIYDEPSKVAAQRAAQAWLERLPDMVAKEFRETSVALRSWWDEIFAWYDYPVSNAYTESVNRLAKDLNRMGRGYSFDVVRARLLLDPEARKPTTKSIRSRTPKPSTNSGFSSFAGSMSMGRMVPQIAYDITEKTVEYGPHIPTLCRLLEAGHFD